MSTLLKGITSKHHWDFYCLNCLHSFKTENKENDFSGILMLSEKDNILEFNQHMKSGKMSYIIYADIESLIRKIDRCANNSEKSSTAKIGEHIPCVYSMPKVWRFGHIEDNHALYRGKDCMKMFCTSLREHAKNIIYFEKKTKFIEKSEIIVIIQLNIGAAPSICNLK